MIRPRWRGVDVRYGAAHSNSESCARDISLRLDEVKSQSRNYGDTSSRFISIDSVDSVLRGSSLRKAKAIPRK